MYEHNHEEPGYIKLDKFLLLTGSFQWREKWV